VSEWKSLGDELTRMVMESTVFDDEDKAIFLASKERGRLRQEALRRGEKVEPIPNDWAHDGSEIHADGSAGYRCHICHDARFVRRDVPINHPDFGKAFPCRCQTEHPQVRAEKLQRLLRNNGLPVTLQESTLDSFKPIEGTRFAHGFARDFVNQMRDLQTPRWLAFMGAPGTGKTHLLAGITLGVCVEVSAQAMYFDARDFLMKCKRNDFEQDEYWTDHAIRLPVLVLDELTSVGASEWDVRKLERVIMTRWDRDLPTVVGSTRTDDDFREWSPAIYSRFADVDRGTVLYLTCGDYRQRPRSE